MSNQKGKQETKRQKQNQYAKQWKTANEGENEQGNGNNGKRTRKLVYCTTTSI